MPPPTETGVKLVCRDAHAVWVSIAQDSSHWLGGHMLVKVIGRELKIHAPFTAFGALTGFAIIAVITCARVPDSTSHALFWTLHPMHVLFSAMVTAGIYRLHSKGGALATLLVGYLGSVGIATLSDSVIPYIGEYLLALPNRGIHFGFIEKWWLVNPLAVLGIGIARVYPKTKFPHAGHVMLSTWASVFHMSMALGEQVGVLTLALMTIFLFLAVWVPCCTSDIVFPLLFSQKRVEPVRGERGKCRREVGCGSR